MVMAYPPSQTEVQEDGMGGLRRHVGFGRDSLPELCDTKPRDPKGDKLGKTEINGRQFPWVGTRTEGIQD